MRKTWAFFLSEWQHVVRDRVALLMLVVMPILFTAVLSAVFGGSGNAPLRIGVVPGEPDLTRKLIQVLGAEEGLAHVSLPRAEAEDRLRRTSLEAVLVVPPSLATPVGFQIITDPTTQRGYDAYTRLMGVQAAVSGEITAASLAARIGGSDPHQAAARYWTEPLPPVRVLQAWKTVPEGVLQVSPGMLVMFILMFAAYSGEGTVQERANGTLRRLMAAPVSGWHYLAGRLIGKVGLGMVQFLCLAGFGAAIFRVNWGGAPAMMLLTALVFSTTSAAFGLFLGTLCRTPDQLSAVATTVCLALAALGGTWWPLEITPPALQAIGQALPTGQAMRAFQSLIMYGSDGMATAGGALLYMGAWGALFLLLGVSLFRTGWRRRGAVQQARTTG